MSNRPRALDERLTRLTLNLPDSIEVWLVDIGATGSSADGAPPTPITGAPEWTAALTQEEVDRANRFKRAHLRSRWQITRTALRHLLGELLDVAPSDVKLETTDAGRPYVADTAFDFNVSHSGGYALIAIRHGPGEIGVDIELKKPARDLQRLAATVCTGRERDWLAENEHREVEAFYQLWTCKEAYLKALGTGLQLDMRKVDVDLTWAHQPGFIAAPDVLPALTLGFSPVAGYQAALVLLAKREPDDS